MALQNSGAISLDDIHVEAGGTSGTSATINDSDIRSMICKSCGATADFGEYYGATSTTYVEGSGGTTNTSGNFKFHIFNSSSNFVINAAATGTASSTVDYIVIAGGGGAAGVMVVLVEAVLVLVDMLLEHSQVILVLIV